MANVKFYFRGCSVLITGASQGIGLSIANAFLKSGATVINMSKSPQKIRNSPGLKFVQMDVTDTGSVRRWIKEFTRKGRIDILINNAGVYPREKLLEVSEEQWDKIFDTNLKGLFFISRMVAEHMKRHRKGVIINASSFAAVTPSVGA